MPKILIMKILSFTTEPSSIYPSGKDLSKVVVEIEGKGKIVFDTNDNEMEKSNFDLWYEIGNSKEYQDLAVEVHLGELSENNKNIEDA